MHLQESPAQHEKRAVEQVLETWSWNQSAAVLLLEVCQHTNRFYMKKLGIIKNHISLSLFA